MGFFEISNKNLSNNINFPDVSKAPNSKINSKKKSIYSWNSFSNLYFFFQFQA